MAQQKKKTGTSSASSQSTVNHTTVVVMNGDGNSAGTARPRRRSKKQSPTEKLKRKIASVTGIPTTASGRKKKAERVVANFLMDKIDAITGKKPGGNDK